MRIERTSGKDWNFYERDDVKRVVEAYQHIFEDVTPALEKYWDFARKREWSCLTTDFRTATFDQYEALTEAAMEIESGMRSAVPKEKGDALKAASVTAGVGFSLGLCPWTDHALHRTFSPKKNRVTIIVGHDWYPIVPRRGPKRQHPVDMPLRAVGLHDTPKYHDVVPQSLLDATADRGDSVLLFLNLVPDFRPPGTDTTGKFPGYEYSDWLDGFRAVVQAVSRRYKGRVSIISWGRPVWELLAADILATPKVPLLKWRTIDAPGQSLEFGAGEFRIPYIPTAHPAKNLNVRQGYHLAHVRLAFEQSLRLGPPGASPQEINRQLKLKGDTGAS